MREVLEIFGFIAVIFTVIVGLVLALTFAIEKPNCKYTADLMGYESYFSLSTQCMIKVDGKLIPIRSYRVIK